MQKGSIRDYFPFCTTTFIVVSWKRQSKIAFKWIQIHFWLIQIDLRERGWNLPPTIFLQDHIFLWAKSLFNKTKILHVRLTACDISVEEEVIDIYKILLLLCAPLWREIWWSPALRELGAICIIIYIDPLLKSLVAYINIIISGCKEAELYIYLAADWFGCSKQK